MRFIFMHKKVIQKATFVLFNESLQNLFQVVSKPELKQHAVESRVFKGLMPMKISLNL